MTPIEPIHARALIAVALKETRGMNMKTKADYVLAVMVEKGFGVGRYETEPRPTIVKPEIIDTKAKKYAADREAAELKP